MIRTLCLLLVLVALCSSCTSDAAPRSEPDAFWQTRVVTSFDGGAGVTFEGDSLFFYRLFDGLLLEDDNVVLGVTGTQNHLIFLDSLGRTEAVVGRSGGGPGEFQSIFGLYPIEEGRVGAFDLQSRRLTTASRDGVERTFSTTGVPINEPPLGFLAPDLVVSTPRVSNVASANSVEPGTVRSYQLWRLTDTGLEAAGSFGGFIEPPSHRATLENLNGPNYGSSFGRSCLPEVHHAAAGLGLWVGESHTGRLALIDSVGDRRIEITDSARATLSRESLAAFDEMVAQLESELGSFTAASKQEVRDRIGVPGEPIQSAWSEIEIDPTGRAWLQRAVCYDDPTHRVWDIFSMDGEKLGSVSFPESVRVLAVRGDRVLVTETDPLGVELLRLLEIER